jgi:hypothetical protein
MVRHIILHGKQDIPRTLLVELLHENKQGQSPDFYKLYKTLLRPIILYGSES